MVSCSWPSGSRWTHDVHDLGVRGLQRRLDPVRDVVRLAQAEHGAVEVDRQVHVDGVARGRESRSVVDAQDTRHGGRQRLERSPRGSGRGR